MAFDVWTADRVECEICGEEVVARVSGCEATVEIDADLDVCETTSGTVFLHLGDGDE